jgi:hypothetical protein
MSSLHYAGKGGGDGVQNLVALALEKRTALTVWGGKAFNRHTIAANSLADNFMTFRFLDCILSVIFSSEQGGEGGDERT